MEALNIDIFKLIADQWGLVAAGSANDFNAMTVNWGSLGVMWGKSVVTVYVKPIRYTSEYLDREEYFTLSFFPERYKNDLGVLGTYSGRDCDKLSMTSLTPEVTGKGIVFSEAELTLVCKKLYSEPMKLERIPSFAVEKYYKEEAPHIIYVGEVLEIIDKRSANSKPLTARCFGSFEVYSKGAHIEFRRAKAKELLAYLIDRRGAIVNSRELCALLWEDKAYDKRTVNYLHQLTSELRRALTEVGAENVLIKHPQGYSVDTSLIDCDYYRFLVGDIADVRSFTGEYMNNYAWSEYTCGYLYSKYRSIEKQ